MDNLWRFIQITCEIVPDGNWMTKTVIIIILDII